MYRIIDKRGSGKTSRLMLLAKETDATIVCSNPEAFAYKAKAYGLEGIEFITYEDYFNYILEDKSNKYLIDELDGLLQCFDNNIIGYCLTPED